MCNGIFVPPKEYVMPAKSLQIAPICSKLYDDDEDTILGIDPSLFTSKSTMHRLWAWIIRRWIREVTIAPRLLITDWLEMLVSWSTHGDEW